MTKARDLANLIAAGNPLADGAIAYSEVTGTPTIPVAGTDFVAQTGGTFTGDVSFGDNDKAIFGAGSDLEILHNSSNNNSIIRELGAGVLSIQTNGSQITFYDSTNAVQMAAFNTGGSCDLAFQGTTKLATTSTGVDVSGELIADSYNETYSALSGTTPTVDCETGNVFSLSTSGNTTFTFTNPPASGTAYGFTIKLTAGGTHTITWPASVDWAGATAPDAPASGETNVLVFITHDGGTTWYGFQGGAAMA